MPAQGIEQNLVVFLRGELAVRVFYQHLGNDPGSEFVWFRRNGDDRLDTIDGTGEPDIIYFDVEAYASDLDTFTVLVSALRGLHDYRGPMGVGTVEDIAVTDQQDDYEPQASGNSLPDFSAAFRVTVTMYEE